MLTVAAIQNFLDCFPKDRSQTNTYKSHLRIICRRFPHKVTVFSRFKQRNCPYHLRSGWRWLKAGLGVKRLYYSLLSDKVKQSVHGQQLMMVPNLPQQYALSNLKTFQTYRLCNFSNAGFVYLYQRVEKFRT